MARRLQKVPVAKYVAAVEAIPSVPAYCVQEQVLDGYKDSAPPPATPAPGTGVYVPFSPLRPIYRTVKTCYPARPGRAGVPARVDYFANSGWNAGGRSRSQFPTSGMFRCVLPTPLVAVQVGITDSAFNHQYDHMSISLVARATGYTIVAYGVTVQSEQSYTPGALLEIERLEGIVRFYLDGVEAYATTEPAYGETYAGVLLYSTADNVDDPEFQSYGLPSNFGANLPALRVLGTDTDLMLMDTELPPLALQAQLSSVPVPIVFSAELPALRVLGTDRPLALMTGELANGWKMTAVLSAPEIPLNEVTITLPLLTLNALLVTGQSTSFEAAMPRQLYMLGTDRPLTFVDTEIPVRLRLQAYEPYMPAGEIDGSEPLYLGETSTLETALLLVGMDSLDVSSTVATITVVLELSGMDSLGIADDASFGSMVEMLAMERVAINSSTTASRQQALQYAVNAFTGALTSYREFGFSGFTYDRGTTYGWMPDGLYRIGGALDNGDFVQALVDFGARDFGDSHVKRIEHAYVGVRTDGQCFLRVQVDDGSTRVYRLNDGPNQKRAKLAKGVSGRMWNVTLELADAAFATVDNVELEVGITQRRGFGYRN